MKISIFGTGYVGLVTGVCFADLGNDVICVDIDPKKLDSLAKGMVPFYEPGLAELLQRSIRQGRIAFTEDAKRATEHADVIFICVGTPQMENGQANLAFIDAVAKTIAQNLKKYVIIADKSTVPVGTADRVRRIIASEVKCGFDVVSCPEFLREGAAVKDFQNPDRIVIGMDDDRPKKTLTDLFSPLTRTSRPLLFMDVKSAELAKYA
ncbi:MAG: nucleotide sugar dehydrogenase, partial [Nanoarchaeota archaeon]